MKQKTIMPLAAIIAVTLMFPHPAHSKECPLLPEKQGTFEFLTRTDYAWYQCGFTKAEVNDNLKELAALVATVRKNPVLAGLKGFDARVQLYTISDCGGTAAYGIPVRVSFGLCSWFQCDGKGPVRITMEPPEWSVMVNDMVPGWVTPLSSAEGRVFFSVPAKKETIRPGIDVYDHECYIMYNPDRPAYWLPVTVKEAYAAMVEDAKKDKDAYTRQFMLNFMEKEWAAFSEADRSRPAYTVGTNENMPRILGKLSADATGLPLVRVNPAYWNKGLPRSAIQFIYCRIINNKAYIRKEKEFFLQKNSISYNLYRFLETLNNDTAASLLHHIRK
ncbi:MAG TPA: hypothetical protein PLA65_01500 [Spirochaetota bacterium]|nr:hypothetical protein [Spirochaetota bacterium]HOD14891.1 hypothetical protein [Spirochaetota bacterium]HPG49315.1 hypothetical protein [Spirochaetota bacterium]HPN10709.1 hypothetical protein [Spirochaetota bacterium]